MDYKEKYKNALEWARQVMNGETGFIRKEVEEVFPELEENEDERIRKEILEYFQQFENEELRGVNISDWIAWLEKQGEQILANSAKTCKDEQKPADKVEPKFKVGDWIIRSAEGFKHNTYLVTEVKDYYVCEDLKGRRVTFTFNDVHKNFKSWDVSDAKDGDVLVSGQIIILFKNFEEDSYYNFVIAHAGIDLIGKLQITNRHWFISNEAKPATKEQREQLEKAMADAGYTFDFEKKELKKFPTPADVGFEELGKAWAEEVKDKKSVWSEEDEKMLNDAIGAIGIADYYTYDYKQEIENWLKSLKERYTWKPSEEQIEALNEVINHAANSELQHWSSFIYTLLKSLREQLKKLKG